MKPASIPRSLIIFIFVLVITTFLVGTFRAFNSVHAIVLVTPTVTAQTDQGAVLTPTPVPSPVLFSADTTGVIVLAIVIVIIMLIGIFVGESRPQKK